jgi:hypothetical protein
MKQLILCVLLILALTSPSYAFDSIEAVIEAHYSADLAGDINQMLQTMNMDYITTHLADEETYRAYISGNKAVYKTLEASVSNIEYDLSNDGTLALAKYDVQGKFEVIETKEILNLKKSVGAYLQNKSGKWLINFTMDADMMSLKLESGATELSLALTEIIALEDAERPIFNQEESLKIQFEEAVESLGSFNEATLKQVSNEELQPLNTPTENESEYDFEKIIADQEAAHRKKIIIGILIPVVVIGGGTGAFFYYKKREKK